MAHKKSSSKKEKLEDLAISFKYYNDLAKSERNPEMKILWENERDKYIKKYLKLKG